MYIGKWKKRRLIVNVDIIFKLCVKSLFADHDAMLKLTKYCNSY